MTHDGKTVNVNGARELAKFLADSDEVHEAFAEQLFHHLVQQPVRAYGPRSGGICGTTLPRTSFNIRKLAVEMMASSALTGRAGEG